MKFLIAGLGSIGRRHLGNLLALGEREILLYRTRRATLPDADLADLPVTTDLDAALAWGPEGVIVSNPTALHLDVAIPAAQAGCHLLLEKPVSHSLEGVEMLKAAVRAHGVQVLVGYQFRFHPGLQTAARLLEGGAIGRVLSFHAHWGEFLPGWHPWEDYRRGYSARSDLGGGVILTLSHPLDYLRGLFGEVEAVWAFAGRQVDLSLDVEDTAEIGLRFKNGVLGSVHLDYNQKPASHRLEVVGSRGTLSWDYASGRVSLFTDEEAQASSLKRGSLAGSWTTFPVPPNFERNEMFLAEMRHFLAILRGEAQPVCTLQDGIQAMRLGLAAIESAENERLVKLGE